MQPMEDAVKFANNDMDEAKTTSVASVEAKAVVEADSVATSKNLTVDVKSLAELHHECMAGYTAFEEGTKSRGEELAALAKAKKVFQRKPQGLKIPHMAWTMYRFCKCSSLGFQARVLQIERCRTL